MNASLAVSLLALVLVVALLFRREGYGAAGMGPP